MSEQACTYDEMREMLHHQTGCTIAAEEDNARLRELLNDHLSQHQQDKGGVCGCELCCDTAQALAADTPPKIGDHIDCPACGEERNPHRVCPNPECRRLPESQAKLLAADTPPDPDYEAEVKAWRKDKQMRDGQDRLVRSNWTDVAALKAAADLADEAASELDKIRAANERAERGGE